MPSPFPGMDPYLEHPSSWRNLHLTLVLQMRNALVEQVRPRYFAGTEEMLFLHEASAKERRRHFADADASVAMSFNAPSRSPGSPDPSEVGGGGVATAAPPLEATLPAPVHIDKHRSISIRDKDTPRIVTVIEVLSPTNQNPGSDREQYLGKRQELLRSQVHFVEIDLLRRGPRMPMEPAPDTPYCVMVSRREERPRVGVWPIGLRDGPPTIPIPLDAPDPDATLDLQPLLTRSSDEGGFADVMYADPPDPPLDQPDAAWARNWLESAPHPS